MTSDALLDLSARFEPWIWGAAGASLVALGLIALLRARRPARPRLDGPLSPGTERTILLVVVLVALAVRLVGWDSALTPVFWFSEMSTLYVAPMLRDGTLWPSWVAELRRTQAQHPHEAAGVLPILAAMQALVGPRFGLPVLGGALVGTVTIVLAWAFGRRVVSPAFGLVFAAFVAFSPLQITWSRLSPLCSTGAMHVLLTLVVAWEAGRRGSVLWAIGTGLLAWASIYQYQSARIVIPISAAALVAAGQRTWRVRRALVLVLITATAFLASGYLIHGKTLGTELWPSYGGYAGSKGERSVREFVDKNIAIIATEAVDTVRHYFAERRAGWTGTVTERGLRDGGLVLVPTAFLGVVGMLVVVARLRRQWLWLVLAASGFAVTAFSSMTARRALVFDVAWCAFAAFGLLALADTIGRTWSRGARAAVVAVTAGLVAAWSVFAVFVLSAAVLPTSGQHIPFGEAGFGDGVACKRCLEAAKGWADEMADGAFVVLFDNDAWRENRTSPGGLPMYGKVATLPTGRDRFVDAYTLFGAWDIEPPTPGPMFEKTRIDFASELAKRIAASGATRILWHFERPTAWEGWLGGQLVAAGGRFETFATPLSPRPGVRVTTPIDERSLGVIRSLARGLARDDESRCVTLREAGHPTAVAPVYLLATGDDGIAGPPEWIAASWRNHRYGTSDLATFTTPVAGTVEGNRILLLGEQGEPYAFELPAMTRTVQPGRPNRIGLNCAARVGAHWWVVDPRTGHVTSEDRMASLVPRGSWIGIAAGPNGTVVLADATQQIAVIDARGAVAARFPARVFPSVRDVADECSPIAAGAGWVATIDLRSTIAAFYDVGGHDLGSKRMDRLIPVPHPFTAIAGAGRYLGVAAGANVRSYEVVIDPACASANETP